MARVCIRGSGRVEWHTVCKRYGAVKELGGGCTRGMARGA